MTTKNTEITNIKNMKISNGVDNRKISIIVPCYNEEKTVGLVIKRLTELTFPGWTKDIIVVNDGSKDGTAVVLSEFESLVKVINMPKNGGKGTAVKEGIKNATGDYAIIQDADLECKPEEIGLLLNALENIKSEEKIAVMGSRELHKDHHKSNLLSRVGSLSITMMINFLYRSSLTDTLMCYKLFPKSTFAFFNGGGFEAEMLFLTRLLQDGYKVLEVPVSYDPRDKSEGKKINYRHGIKILWKIFTFWVKGLFN
jgi:glycosyltransferase involved in cell wall biosynthesis